MAARKRSRRAWKYATSSVKPNRYSIIRGYGSMEQRAKQLAER
jgi:hypothetical protein